MHSRKMDKNPRNLHPSSFGDLFVALHREPNQVRINSLKREAFRALSFYSVQVHLGKSIPT